MNKSEVLSFAKKAVPWITAAASGNVPALIHMAAEAVGLATGRVVEPTKEAVVAAIASATHAELLAMKQEEDNFALKMREFGYKEASELMAAEFADTAGARSRDVELMKVTGKINVRASAMLLITILALVGLVLIMLFRDVDANTALGGVILLLIGKFSNAWDTAFNFEFGTNRSSKDKDATIKALTK